MITRLFFAIGAGLVMSTAALAQSTDTPDLLPGESVIRVEAEGSIERMPDILVMGVTIVSEGSNPQQAAEGNIAKLTKLVHDLASIGIHETSISAEQLEAQPIFADENGRSDRSRVIGYRARQTIGIELNDLSRLQPVVTRLVQDGYGEMRAGFHLRDPKAAEAEAQRAAIKNAKAEADNIASALGKRVSRLLLVGNNQEAYRGWDNYGDSIIVTGSRIQPLVLKPAPIEIEAKVYVDWSLVDR